MKTINSFILHTRYPYRQTAETLRGYRSMEEIDKSSFTATGNLEFKFMTYLIVSRFDVELQIMANSKARSTAYVSFDGRNQQELRVGDRCVPRIYLFVYKLVFLLFLTLPLSLSLFSIISGKFEKISFENENSLFLIIFVFFLENKTVFIFNNFVDSK